MRVLRRFLVRICNLAPARRGNERLREEMEEHIALQTEENLRTGMAHDHVIVDRCDPYHGHSDPRSRAL